jgi:hypothetical protein
MYSLRSAPLAVLSVLLQSGQGGLAGSPSHDCGWPETEPAQFANRRDAIEWGSDADRREPRQDSAYAFSRFVANRGPVPLLVHWDVGGVLLPALAPGQVATLCERLPMWPYMIYGPIAYEQGAAPVHTTVWQAGYDSRDIHRMEGRPLEVVFTIAPADTPAPAPVAVRVVTILRRADVGGGFQASYEIENQGTEAVEVTWPVAPNITRQLGAPRTLGPRVSTSNRVSLQTGPGLPVYVHVALTVGALNSKSALAIVAIPTFVVRELATAP